MSTVRLHYKEIFDVLDVRLMDKDRKVLRISEEDLNFRESRLQNLQKKFSLF